MEMLECVAFMLIEDEAVLAERRSKTKVLAPGAVAIPGERLEAGELPEEGVRRELREELELDAGNLLYVCSLLDRSQEPRRIHYYAIESWQGEIANNEAAELLWIPLASPENLDFSVDRLAVAEFGRLYSKL